MPPCFPLLFDHNNLQPSSSVECHRDAEGMQGKWLVEEKVRSGLLMWDVRSCDRGKVAIWRGRYVYAAAAKKMDFPYMKSLCKMNKRLSSVA